MDRVCVKGPAGSLRNGCNSNARVRVGSGFTDTSSIRSCVSTRGGQVSPRSRGLVAISVGTSRSAGVKIVASIGRTLHRTGTLGVDCSTMRGEGWCTLGKGVVLVCCFFW